MARQLKLAEQHMADGPDKPLLDLHFADASRGMVVGAYNLFFETSDGGRTWKSAMGRLDNARALHLYAIRAKNTLVLAAGEQGSLFRSVDGGRSFSALPSPYAGSWFSLAMQPDNTWVIAGLRGHVLSALQSLMKSERRLSETKDATVRGPRYVADMYRADLYEAIKDSRSLKSGREPKYKESTVLAVLSELCRCRRGRRTAT